MDWSLTLGTVRGIKIRIHVTFLLIIPWAAYNWGIVLGRGWPGALYGIVFTSIIFLCVVLHELAHSLVATFYGVRVREIELSPIGGLAKMDSMPEKPYQEFVMALAGPLVNLIIAVPLGWVVLLLIGSRSIMSLGHLIYLMSKPSWQGFILNLFATNVLLALFNLLPAFPMDGGRVLRSALTWGVGQRQATRWAARVGQGLAAIMVLAGLLTGNLMLPLIAVFVFFGAQQEERLTELQALLSNLLVSQALITPCPTLAAEETLDTVLQRAMRGHPAPFAVVEGERLLGLLTRSDITSALEVYGPNVRVGDIMRREFPTVSPTDTLVHARQLMATSGLRGLPVTEGGRLLGMVTARQIHEIYGFLSAQQRKPQSQGIRL
jgi:Zn-dependent protease